MRWGSRSGYALKTTRIQELEYLANALMAGVVLGARVPIVLTSRADTAETRTASCAVVQLMAHKKREALNA
jgi:phosphate acetyltransferase